MIKPPFLLIFCLVVFASLSFPSAAQIYKYKDANGKWQFTDKPPKNGLKTETLNYQGKKKSAATKDLSKKLTKKFNPSTVIEKTTLAVVSIETALGSGSGFFVSDDGYIVTNKHVVRPTEFKAWKKSDKKFDEAKEDIKEAEQALAEREEELKRMEAELNAYKKDIDRYNDREKKVAYSEYEIYEKRLNKMKANYQKRKKRLEKQKRELSSKDSDFSFRSANAKFSRSFKVTLKGGTKSQGKVNKAK